jgi:hypothetical protein
MLYQKNTLIYNSYGCQGRKNNEQDKWGLFRSAG